MSWYSRRRKKRRKHLKNRGFQPPKIQEQGNLPICKCGQVVKYAGQHVCEDCFVKMQIRWSGKATRARVHL